MWINNNSFMAEKHSLYQDLPALRTVFADRGRFRHTTDPCGSSRNQTQRVCCVLTSSLRFQAVEFFRVENKISCKVVDLVFQSFLTITKSAELKNSFVNKDTLCMNYTSGRCQQATNRFVKLYC